jgi:cell division protein FtsB
MSQSSFAYSPLPTYGNRNLQPNDRFYVRSSVYLPNGEVDPATGLLRGDVRRRGRTQAMRMEGGRLDNEYAGMEASIRARAKEKGARISFRLGATLILLIITIGGLCLLVQQGTLTQKMKSVVQKSDRIATLQQENAALQAQIDEASDAAAICYAAARDLDMIPANATQAIHLTAVDTRPTENPGAMIASADQVNTATAETVGQ